MAYTPTTTWPTSPLRHFQWARPDGSNPALTAPFSATDTTIYWSVIPKDYLGATITGNFIMGVRSATSGLVTPVYVPASAVAADGLSATGVLHIRLDGTDYTTATSDTPIDHNVDDAVFCAVDAVYENIVSGILSATIGLNASAIPYYTSAPTFTPGSNQLCSILYADNLAIAGSPDASTTTKGIVEQAVQSEYDARTVTGDTGAPLFVNPGTVRGILYNDYAASSAGTDTYAITITPAITAYAAGQVFTFKADVANTGACTLNVSGLGAKSLKVYGSDPVDGYIGAGAMVSCAYDGTNMIILSVGNQSSISQNGSQIYGGTSNAGTDTYVATLTPAIAAYVTGEKFSFKTDVQNTGAASINYNTVGALTLKKWTSAGKQDLSNGDLAAGQIVTTQYDGTDAVVTSPLANFTGRLSTSTTPVDTHSTTGEQTLMSVSVPINTLQSANGVRATLYVSDFDLANGATITLRLKYGSTTIATSVLGEDGATSLTNLAGKIEALIRGAGATNSQRGDLYSCFGTANSAAAASDVHPMIFDTTGTAAEDSTGALNFIITAEMSSSSTAIGLVTSGYFVEKLQ